MSGPKLRTVNKAVAPYDLNKFPSKFLDTFVTVSKDSVIPINRKK